MISLCHGRSGSLFAERYRGALAAAFFFLFSRSIEHICAAERYYVEVLAHIFGHENRSILFAAHEVKPLKL